MVQKLVILRVMKDGDWPPNPVGLVGVGAYFSGQCTSLGMLVRFAGDNVMMSPPLIITSDEIEEVNSFSDLSGFSTNHFHRILAN